MDYTVIIALVVISYGLGYLSVYQIYRYIRKNFDKIIEAKDEHINCLTEILNGYTKTRATETLASDNSNIENYAKYQAGRLEYVGTCECYKPHPISQDAMSRCANCGGNIL